MNCMLTTFHLKDTLGDWISVKPFLGLFFRERLKQLNEVRGKSLLFLNLLNYLSVLMSYKNLV